MLKTIPKIPKVESPVEDEDAVWVGDAPILDVAGAVVSVAVGVLNIMVDDTLVGVGEMLVLVGNEMSDIAAAVTEACRAALAALHSWPMESCAHIVRSVKPMIMCTAEEHAHSQIRRQLPAKGGKGQSVGLAGLRVGLLGYVPR
jgi:hypothetical protein